jgi:hypothetical protein
MTRLRPGAGASLFLLLALAGCDRGGDNGGASRQTARGNGQAEAEPQTVDIPQTVEAVAPGTTPMAERVAVLGLLNKRNGISRELTLKPGEATRVGDVIVRLRACETAAPWEVQKLTGAFVQLDVRNPQGQFQRVFSGWLYKETPSLNLVEHPVYDVWPKSCAMTHPNAAEEDPEDGAAPANKRSSAPNSAASARPKAAAPSPPSKAEANSAR